MKLKDICKFVNEKVDTSSFHLEDYVSTENLLPNKGGVTVASKIPQGKATLFKKGDILISNIRPYFKKIYLAKKHGCCSNDVLCIRPNSNIPSSYLYYLLSQDSFFDYVMTGAKGTKMPRGDKGHIMNWAVYQSTLSQQQNIAEILTPLDDKIAVNSRICANLEAQAQALFKSWFVDFTPFKDQPFVDSELGPIPQGWKVGKLGDIGEIVGGSTPSKSKPEYYTTHGIAWLTPKDLSTSKAKFTSRGEIDITDEGYNSTSTKLMPRGSVLFSSRAPIGYLTIAKNEICTNQGFKSLVPNGAGTGFIYYTLRHLTPQIENRATGSTFKEASATLMRSVETIVPPTSILNKFEELLRPILQFQEKKEEENQRLAALRDTLLPKLMSGEIKL